MAEDRLNLSNVDRHFVLRRSTSAAHVFAIFPASSRSGRACAVEAGARNHHTSLDEIVC
jgi:hypothetical protein